ncbi:hypothetical protein GCM10007855_15000 [Aliivibrio sifiae]|uniref:Uncharacterized protein n=1 Tax=Aliivibrio sifiae TaxID=566293 RepID=A0ABQ6AIK3_9GAMM|nr:hypothetical protein GCM10007855_15000 [Aliivibrio sifiae]
MEESLERAVKSAAEGASPYLKNDKGETLRQKDRGESDPINLGSILLPIFWFWYTTLSSPYYMLY